MEAPFLVEMVALTILFTSNLFLLPKALSLYLAGTTFPISSEYMSDVIRMNLLPVSVKSLRLYNACLAWEKSISKMANPNWFSTQWMVHGCRKSMFSVVGVEGRNLGVRAILGKKFRV